MLPTDRMSQLMKSDCQEGLADCQSLVQGGSFQGFQGVQGVQGVQGLQTAQEQNVASNVPRVKASVRKQLVYDQDPDTFHDDDPLMGISKKTVDLLSMTRIFYN